VVESALRRRVHGYLGARRALRTGDDEAAEAWTRTVPGVEALLTESEREQLVAARVRIKERARALQLKSPPPLSESVEYGLCHGEEELASLRLAERLPLDQHEARVRAEEAFRSAVDSEELIQGWRRLLFTGTSIPADSTGRVLAGYASRIEESITAALGAHGEAPQPRSFPASLVRRHMRALHDRQEAARVSLYQALRRGQPSEIAVAYRVARSEGIPPPDTSDHSRLADILEFQEALTDLQIALRLNDVAWAARAWMWLKARWPNRVPSNMDEMGRAQLSELGALLDGTDGTESNRD
jgi:hypothetical protein